MSKIVPSILLLVSFAVVPAMPAIAALGSATWCPPAEMMDCMSMAVEQTGTMMPCCANSERSETIGELGSSDCCLVSSEAAREIPVEVRVAPQAQFALARANGIGSVIVEIPRRAMAASSEVRPLGTSRLFVLNDAWLI